MAYKIIVQPRSVHYLITLGLGLLMNFSSIAWAKELPKQPVLPLALAYKAALAAVEQCKKEGYQVSAAVVDRSGVVKALLRSDGAGAHTIDSSRRKAYTAASLREATQKFAKLIAKKPEIQALRDMNESILILGGGFPIKIADEVVGGIGVGGAPGAALDEGCARAGLEAIGADLYKESD